MHYDIAAVYRNFFLIIIIIIIIYSCKRNQLTKHKTEPYGGQ